MTNLPMLPRATSLIRAQSQLLNTFNQIQNTPSTPWRRSSKAVSSEFTANRWWGNGALYAKPPTLPQLATASTATHTTGGYCKPAVAAQATFVAREEPSCLQSMTSSQTPAAGTRACSYPSWERSSEFSSARRDPMGSGRMPGEKILRCSLHRSVFS